MPTVEQMIHDIIQREGGYVNHPNDRGGPTKFGVTQATLSAWLGREVTVEDVQNLTESTASDIFEMNYFIAPGLNKLPVAVHAVAFDISVHSGPRRSIKLVQKAINAAGFGPCVVDGVLGPDTVTRATLAQSKVGDLFNNTIVMERIKFLEGIIEKDPSQEAFRDGWMNRAKSFFKRG